MLEFKDAKKLIAKLDALAMELFDDFEEVKSAFDEMKGKYAEDIIEPICDGYERRVQAAVLFSGALGLEANRDHFRDPFKPTVLDVDSSEFLREGALTMMPHYAKAERDISAHFHDLPNDAMQAVMEYYIYLETCGTKLAHFKAFILGDELLLYTEPGYAPDRVLSYNYRRMLSEWFRVEESAL
ncbi:MAG: hypothetical protein IJN34_07230 [Clostridia bacterium]|nr:hypothetical protein [Clostridia bacterium]